MYDDCFIHRLQQVSTAMAEVMSANQGASLYYDYCSSEEVNFLNEAFNIIQDQINVAQVRYVIGSVSLNR